MVDYYKKLLKRGGYVVCSALVVYGVCELSGFSGKMRERYGGFGNRRRELKIDDVVKLKKDSLESKVVVDSLKLDEGFNR